METLQGNKDEQIDNAQNEPDSIPKEVDNLLNALPKNDNIEKISKEEDMTSDKPKTFDDILVHLGEFGRYQKIVYFLLFMPTIFSAMHKMAWVFLGAKVNHRCRLPSESIVHPDFTTLPYQSKVNISNRFTWDEDNNRFDQCSWIDDNKKELPCDNGWIYDRTTFGSSAVMEWNLVG